ncbi:hypothetical protein ACA910_007604 [Epithemia clementina (nom. ined.)]
MKFSNILLLLVLVLRSANAEAAAVHQEHLRRRGSSAHTTHHHAHDTTTSSSEDQHGKQEQHDGGNTEVPCPKIACFDPCQGQCLGKGQKCVTKTPPSSNGCSTCPVFVRCKKERGGGSGGDSGVACGNTVCPVGLECCNALCGICVIPGNFCIQGCASPSDGP